MKYYTLMLLMLTIAFAMTGCSKPTDSTYYVPIAASASSPPVLAPTPAPKSCDEAGAYNQGFKDGAELQKRVDKENDKHEDRD